MKYMNMSDSHVSEPSQVIDIVLYNAVYSVLLLFLCDVVGIAGIVANIINIVVFKKQGYKDGVNITLTALAVSDIGVLVIEFAYVQAIDPWTDESGFIMLKTNIALLLIYPDEYFIRVSGLITTFAAFQRCLCVLMPLKVNIILDVKVTTFVNVSIFIAMTFSFLLPYSVVYLDWMVLPDNNRSLLSIYFKNNRETIVYVYYLLNGVCVPFLTIFLLLIFTVILIVKIKSSLTWRKNASNNRASVDYKERRAVTMLLCVSLSYIVLLIPHSSLTTAVGLVKEMKAGGRLFKLTNFLFIFGCSFETVCCSLNIIIYYKMSSKFKETFWAIMPIFKTA